MSTDLADAAQEYRELQEWLKSSAAETEDLDEHLYRMVERLGAVVTALDGRVIAEILARYDALEGRRRELTELYERAEAEPFLYYEADPESADINAELAEIADALVEAIR